MCRPTVVSNPYSRQNYLAYLQSTHMPPHLAPYISLFLFALAVYWACVYVRTPPVTITAHESDTFVNFRDTHLRQEYKQQGIRHDARRGTLTQCTSFPSNACRTVHYDLPFYQTNDPNSTILTVNKASTNRVLQLNGLPLPPYVYISNARARSFSAHELFPLFQAQHISFPVVVKPVTGFGGRGVLLNIQSMGHCVRALRQTAQNGEGVIVQQQVQGHHYRILVVNGRVIDILEDVPPRVVGDGTTPVDQLIRAFNRRRKAQGKYTTDVVHWDYIREQLGVPSTATTLIQVVPRRGQTVHITQLKNGYNGVDRLSVPLTAVPARVKDLSVRVAQVLGMNLIGIDYMCADIRRDVPGYIIEVNSVPDYTPHAKQEGKHRPVSRRFVQALFA